MKKNWRALLPALQEIINDEIRNGNECGCQLCIRHHGEVVVDIAAGYTTPEQNEKVSGNSVFPVFSAGKAALAALAWRLVDRGVISFDSRPADFWQEFNTPEKSGITIEHLLSHRAGMYLLPSGNPDLTDWDGMCKKIAAMTPRHTPGEKCHYHPLTFGWLVGHTLELAAGKPLPELIETEILSPAGVSGMFSFGKNIAGKSFVPVDDTRMAVRPSWEALHMNDPRLQQCCIPSFTAIAPARSLAKFYSSLRGGVVSSTTFDYATSKVFRSASDPVKPGDWATFGLGLLLAGPPENRRMFCGHSGANGSEAFYMPDEDIAFAFVKNRLSPEHPHHPVRDRISELLDIPRRVW